MSNFFKRLFGKKSQSQNSPEDWEYMQSLSKEILAEEAIKSEEGQDLLPINAIEMTTPEAKQNFRCYKFYSCTDRGRVKESNQDAIFTSEFRAEAAGQSFHFGMAAVADGMGGLSFGEIASAAAIAAMQPYMHARIAEYIKEGSPTPENIVQHLIMAVKNANTVIYQLGLEQNENMGTTLTYLFLRNQEAYFAHVGDSRGYIFNSKLATLERVTQDHSLVGRMVEMQQITEEASRQHPRKNEIYRMLGLRENIPVDVYVKTLQTNESIILISDGLWEFVSENAILEAIQKGSDLNQTAQNLVSMANEKGGRDNISIVIIQPEA